ncbi:MAG: heparinase II/III family protein [Rhizobacter sp.]
MQSDVFNPVGPAMTNHFHFSACWRKAFPMGHTGLVLATGLLVSSVCVALPSVVKPEHPRVFVSAQRIADVKAVIAPPLISTFPRDRGRLTFDIVPAFAASAGDLSNTPVIDDYEEHRNHVFVRHAPAYDNISAGTVVLQVTLQGPSSATYFSNRLITLPANTQSTIAVGWDNAARQTTIVVNNGAPAVQTWGPSGAWRADGEKFLIRGRAGEQIQHLRVDDLSTNTTVLERGPIDRKLQDASQQLLRPEALLETQTRGLLNCTTAADPSSCVKPYPDLATTRHPNDVEGLARSLALAYLLTDDSRYLDAARNYAGMLLAIGVLEGPAGGEEYAMRGRVGAFSILYDWLFQPMRSAPAFGGGFASLADQMAQRIVDHIVAQKANGTYEFGVNACGYQPITTSPLACAAEPVIEWDRQASPFVANTASYYLAGGHSRGDVAKMAQALLAIHDERPDTAPLLETLYRHYDLGYHKAREWLSVDGGHHMNFGYGAGYNDPNLSERIWQSALQPVGGLPVLDAAWQYKTWLPFLYSLRGDLRLPSTGDAGTDSYLPWDTNLVLRAAVEGADGRAQMFYDQVILPITRPGAFDVNSDGPIGYLWDRVFFGASQTAPVPWTDLPLARHFRNAGFVTMRDRWTFEDATVLDFKSTSFTSQNHHHFDQNSFSLFYRTPLLLDSGYYSAYGDDHWGNYLIRTVAHNSMVVFDPNESFFMDRAWSSNDGGQWLQAGMQTYPTLTEGRTGGNHLKGIEAFAQGDDFSYVRGNASLAYSSAKLDQNTGFVRHLVMLRTPGFWASPVFVLFDQIKLQTGRDALTPTVLFHTTNEPLPLGESARGAGVHDVQFASGSRRILDVVNGSGRVFIETLLPSVVTARKIGGVGSAGDFRFAVSTPTTGGNVALVNYLPSGGSANWAAPDVGAWRIEIGAPGGASAGTTREFLHVMSVAEAASAGLSAPSATKLNASPRSASVLLGGSMVLLIFNGAPSDPVFMDVPVAAAARDFLGVGFQPGERFEAVTAAAVGGFFRVTLQRSGNGALQANDDGALRLKSF